MHLFSCVDDGEAGEIMNILQFFFMSDGQDGCQSPELIGQQQVSSRYPICDPGRV